MNILFLNSLGKNKWGGGEKWMILAAKGLSDRGHDVYIATLKGSVIEQKSKAAVLTTWNFSIPADIAIWKGTSLRKFLKKNKINVLICCQNKDVNVGARAARSAGIPAIFARQGVQNLSNKKKYIKPFTNYIDGIITNTKSIKNVYESFGWFSPSFIHVIYNGVAIPNDVPKIDIHKFFNLPVGSKVMFSAGRLDYQKGFDLLISVAQMAKAKKQSWQFVIAGDGKLKNELRQSAEKQGVADSVHFIGFSDQVLALINSSDVFVLPSRYEGMPNALLEAMALGKPSVATKVNGVPELVEDGISGLLVETENSSQLYERLEQLLSDEGLKKSIEKEALIRIKESFTIDTMIDQLEKLLVDQLALSK